MNFKKATLTTAEEINLTCPNGFSLTLDKGEEIDVHDLVLRPNGIDFSIGTQRFLDYPADKFSFSFHGRHFAS